MFQLLQPIWLFALAGLSIPLIIHLWNRHPGKILKIGSIDFLTESNEKNARSLKLSDLLLFVIRCLLIGLFAITLAKPVWQQTSTKSKGWLLIDRQNLQLIYSQYKLTIDSLVAAGFEWHDFAPGFKKEKAGNVLLQSKKSDTLPNLSYWNLLAALNESVPPELPIELFTGSELKNFNGRRPRLSIAVNWHACLPADSVSISIQEAYKSAGDSIHAIVKNSRPSVTFFTGYELSPRVQPTGAFQLSTRDSGLFIASGNNKPILVDTATLRISIFSGNHEQDAAYLKAAIDAIGEFGKRKMKLTVIGKTAEIPSKQDWLFWLSDLPIKNSFPAKKVFAYENGAETTTRSWITGNELFVEAGEIPLYRYIQSGDSSTAEKKIVWQNGFGQPVLSVQNENKVQWYHFFSRFDPDWNDLPWSNKFPAMLYDLLYGSATVANEVDSTDRRIIDQRQMQPFIAAAGKYAGAKKTQAPIELEGFFWIAIFILFFAERLISFQNKNKGNA